MPNARAQDPPVPLVTAVAGGLPTATYIPALPLPAVGRPVHH
jgi:hypothetical protein